MFEFSTKAKQLAIGLTVVGAILWVVGFAMNGSSSHEADHGHDAHATEMHDDAHGAEAHDAHAEAGHDAHVEGAHDDHGHESHTEEAHDAHGAEAHDAHAEHAHHQQQNRPWSALYVAAIFFLGLGLGQLFFLGIQYVAQAGWSAGLLRVMEAQAFTIIIPLIVIALITFLGLGHVHHMFHWMVEGINIEGHENYDEIIAGKRGFLEPNILYCPSFGIYRRMGLGSSHVAQKLFAIRYW